MVIHVMMLTCEREEWKNVNVLSKSDKEKKYCTSHTINFLEDFFSLRSTHFHHYSSEREQNISLLFFFSKKKTLCEEIFHFPATDWRKLADRE
jgi:hypothetical protein